MNKSRMLKLKLTLYDTHFLFFFKILILETILSRFKKQFVELIVFSLTIN